MKTLFGAVLAVVVLFMAAGIGAYADDSTTLTGEFVWEGGNTAGDLKAEFTPNGDGQWNVEFHFEFRGRPHTYSGSASGSLVEGRLEGRVLNESKKRTFTFEGTFQDGVFSGSHAEMHGDEESSTGTLTLR
jgi:hypothetical protein